MTDKASYDSLFYRSQDDLLLHARVYGPKASRARPVVCLPGLTRNAADFHDLAMALASHPTFPRRVYCLDYRGRGRSQWDADWRNYSPYTELLDVIGFLTLQGLCDVALVGTSRGGIIAMLLAVMRPSALGCVILNDIGPVIETSGLARIIGYAGKIPVPRDWDEARRLTCEMHKRQYLDLDDTGWDKLARQLFHEMHGRPAASYDANIGKAISEIDISKPVPDMWAHFEALAALPVMTLRGENSDILSPATLQAMQAKHPAMQAVTIPKEGHAPLLWDAFSQRLIGDFIASAETSWNAPKAAQSRGPQEMPLV